MRQAIIFDVGGVLLDYERDGMLHTLAGACAQGTQAGDIANLIGDLDLSGGENTLDDFYSELRNRFRYSSSTEQLRSVWMTCSCSPNWRLLET